jgi:hypothetical protein
MSSLEDRLELYKAHLNIDLCLELSVKHVFIILRPLSCTLVTANFACN